MAWGLLAQALHKFFYLKHLPIATGSLAYIFAAICLVPLFLRAFLIVDEDLIDDSGEGIQLRPPRWLAPPIARRSGVAQHLAHRPSRQAKPFGGLALTQTFDKDTAPYLSV